MVSGRDKGSTQLSPSSGITQQKLRPWRARWAGAGATWETAASRNAT